jgi:F-type H+-transporting ATPase subunit b
MLQLVQTFGDSSSGLGALGVSGSAFLIQLVTFVIAFLVLRQWAFKPILRVLQERRETIEKGVKLGEKMQKEQVELEEKVATQLHDARNKADKIVAAAHSQARQTVQEAEDKANEKADGIIASARDRINQDMVRARKQLEGEMASLVSEATEVIIDEKVDAKKDAALMNKALRGQRTA